MMRLLTVRLSRDEDVVVARQRARQIAAALGFDRQDQTRIATAVSEMARNATRYARGGSVEFALDADSPALAVIVTDSGPGIPHLADVLGGRYHSATGMGLGIVGARRIMDAFEIASSPAGTRIEMRKMVPRRSQVQLARGEAQRIAGLLAAEKPATAVEEMQLQNQELLAALEELRRRQDDMARLNAELQDTNRGVVALYAELDEKAESLRRADEMKSRFLSNMTHEFQTPLNSILALTRLLLDRTDGDLTAEQAKQVQFIRQASEDLSELVHDLLDIAKVEAGKVTVRPTEFSVADFLSGLRGLMRPLQKAEAVTLVIAPAEHLPPLYTDEGKLSQILRNYVSNAFKFTEQGTITVATGLEADGQILFRVTDTGIGIPPEDQGRLFQEFGQVPNRLQAKVRGTGLGLSLSKRLAELLGGSVGVESVPGEGSTFWVRLPAVAPGFDRPEPVSPAAGPAMVRTALIVDDELTSRYVLRRSLTSAGCRVIEAAGGEEGLQRAEADRPDVIFLDLRMPDMMGTEVLARLKRNPSTAAIPVIIATSQAMAPEERDRLGAHAAAVMGKKALGSDAGEIELRRALEAANIRP